MGRTASGRPVHLQIEFLGDVAIRPTDLLLFDAGDVRNFL